MLLESVKEWCDKHQIKCEIGKNWCDCVDYTDYINVYLKDHYHFTVYHLDCGKYSCEISEGKTVIVRIENIENLFEITNLLEDYELI